MMSFKYLLFTFCIMPLHFCKAQDIKEDIKFDSSGKLVSITTASAHLIKSANLEELTETANQMRIESRELLSEKVAEAMRILKSNHYKQPLHRLYIYIYGGDSAAMVSYLEGLLSSLNSGQTSSLVSPLAVPFNKAFNDNLSDTAKVFYWEPGSANNRGFLWKKNPLTGFMIDYHNETLKDAKTGAVKINKEDLIEASYYLIEQKNNIDTLLERYRSHLNIRGFNKNLYDSLTGFHNQLIDSKSRFSHLISLFRQSWFKQWFWFRGGEIRINPLDISVRDSLRKMPALDLFHPSGIERSKSNELYLEHRLDTLNGFFRKNEAALFTSQKLINEVVVPDDGMYFNFSATGKLKFNNDEKELTNPLYTTDKKMLAVHNIPRERRLGILEERKADPDRSAFQEGFDGVVANLGQLAAVYAKLTPYGHLLDFFLPPAKYKNNVITTQTIKSGPGLAATTDPIIAIEVKDSVELTISGKADEDFLEKLKQTLKEEGIYDEDAFVIFEHLSITMEEAKGRTKELAGLLKTYLQLVMKKAADQVNLDRFYVNGILTIYNESSSPTLKEIRPRKNNHTVYYSEIVHTTPVDSAVVNNVKLYTVNARNNVDTLVIDRFKYKVGKNKKFTLSAGIAYTLNSYNQSVAREEDGTIKIYNNNVQYRLIAGMNYYLGKGLYSHDNSFWGKGSERNYIFVGISIPKPLENLYAGVGRDLFPGLKLTAGMHIGKNNRYFIQNNEIIEEQLSYQVAGPFVSLAVDPTSLLSVFGIFKKD